VQVVNEAFGKLSLDQARVSPPVSLYVVGHLTLIRVNALSARAQGWLREGRQVTRQG